MNKFKKIAGLQGLILFAVFLWVVLVVAYADQVRREPAARMKMIQMQQDPSCSSSSSGNPE